jgi:osmotically inducible protein OsmC
MPPTLTRAISVMVGAPAAFLKHAQAAKAGCPVSRALASVPEITLEASLAQ